MTNRRTGGDEAIKTTTKMAHPAEEPQSAQRLAADGGGDQGQGAAVAQVLMEAIMSEYPDDIPVVAGILEDDDFDPATEAMENYDQDRWDK